MKMQEIHLRIGFDQYMQLKAKGEANLSLLMRQLLEAYLEYQETREEKDRRQLLTEIEQWQEKVEEGHKNIALLRVGLMKLDEEATKQKQVERDQALAMTRAIKNSGMLGDFLD